MSDQAREAINEALCHKLNCPITPDDMLVLVRALFVRDCRFAHIPPSREIDDSTAETIELDSSTTLIPSILNSPLITLTNYLDVRHCPPEAEGPAESDAVAQYAQRF